MSNTITLSLDNLRGEIAPLYHRYPNQTNAQDAYVEMTEDGEVSADYSGEIGNGMPMSVWHGCTLRWSVPSDVRGNELADLLGTDEAIALLERIYAGHSVEWDGSNHTGGLDDDAQAASEALQDLLNDNLNTGNDGAGVWGVRDWIDAAGLRAWWEDGQSLADAVTKIEDEAESEQVHLDGDIEAELLDWAYSYWERDEPGLSRDHLDALIEDGRITDEEAQDYLDEIAA